MADSLLLRAASALCCLVLSAVLLGSLYRGPLEKLAANKTAHVADTVDPDMEGFAHVPNVVVCRLPARDSSASAGGSATNGTVTDSNTMASAVNNPGSVAIEAITGQLISRPEQIINLLGVSQNINKLKYKARIFLVAHD